MQLVLNKRGAKLSIEDGLFKIKAGEDIKRVSVTKIDSIIMHKSASITTDAVLEAIEHEIDILFMEKTGKPLGRIWSHKFGSISTIRKNQVSFAHSKAGADWIINILMKKADNQAALLLTLGLPDRSTDQKIQETVAKLNTYREKMKDLEYEVITDVAGRLRSIEGACSKLYFSLISEHLPEQYRFAARSQHPAFDMFNALLNYAYGMLYGKTESALIRAGIDPYLGIMHRDEYNRPVLVYDFIEQYRVWADFVVTNLCMQQVIFIEFFRVENNVHYLNEHGKRILIQSFNDYLEEVIKVNGVERSRAGHIMLEAQKFATMLKSFKQS